MRILLITAVLFILSGCTANIIDDWENAVVVRESSAEGGAWYMQIVRGNTKADSCGAATKGQPISGLSVNYQGDKCAVEYRQ